jgi:hypothetical protein
MFRFTIRDVLWLTVVAALGAAWMVDRKGLLTQVAVHKREAAGYQEAFGNLAEAEYARTHGNHKIEQLQRGAEGADWHAMSGKLILRPADVPLIVTKERAIEIVRSLALQPGEQAEFKCEEVPEGYRVFVQWYVLDENGNRSYFPGGHAVYTLAKSGSIVRSTKGL